MEEKVIIYGKGGGEPPIPLTVRIEWLPNGKINPLMYWTPDGTCFKVISQFDGVHLALLKDRDEGLRFSVQSEIIETPEPDSELLHTQYEIYLYLADKRFCERNIIDERYSHAGKEYIPVTMDIFPDGDYELVYFWVRDARYMIERTSSIEPRGSFEAGGVGLWHKVEARLVNAYDDEDPDPQNSIRRFASLYLELNKWFVRVAVSV